PVSNMALTCVNTHATTRRRPTEQTLTASQIFPILPRSKPFLTSMNTNRTDTRHDETPAQTPCRQGGNTSVVFYPSKARPAQPAERTTYGARKGHLIPAPRKGRNAPTRQHEPHTHVCREDATCRT